MVSLIGAFIFFIIAVISSNREETVLRPFSRAIMGPIGDSIREVTPDNAVMNKYFCHISWAIFSLYSNSALAPRSEEHTYELQSRGHVVCRLLLEKKKQSLNTDSTL